MIASLQLSSVNSSVISSPFVMSPEAVRRAAELVHKINNLFLINVAFIPSSRNVGKLLFVGQVVFRIRRDPNFFRRSVSVSKPGSGSVRFICFNLFKKCEQTCIVVYQSLKIKYIISAANLCLIFLAYIGKGIIFVKIFQWSRSNVLHAVEEPDQNRTVGQWLNVIKKNYVCLCLQFYGVFMYSNPYFSDPNPDSFSPNPEWFSLRGSSFSNASI